MRIGLLIIIFCFSLNGSMSGQSESVSLNDEFSEIPELRDTITINFNGSLQKFASFLSETSGITIGVNSSIDPQINRSFVRATVKDIIDYLSFTYNLIPKKIGGIILLDIPLVERVPEKNIDFTWDSIKGEFTVNLSQDTLLQLATAVNEYSDYSVIVDRTLDKTLLNGYFKNVSTPKLFELIAKGSALNYELDTDSKVIHLYPQKVEEVTQGRNVKRSGQMKIERVDSSQFFIDVVDGIPLEVMKKLLVTSGENYVLLPNVEQADAKGNVARRSTANSSDENSTRLTMYVDGGTLTELLYYVSLNSKLDCVNDRGHWIIGRRSSEKIFEVRTKKLMNRSARNILTAIPMNMYEEVTIDSMFEDNSLLLTGNASALDQLESYIDEIDKTVPLVMIELFIVDVQEGNLRDIGVEAGIISGGRPSGGGVISGNPGENSTDFSFGPGAINRVLELLSGRGVINLGRVSNDFYLNLKAVEEKGLIEIKSTPKMSTLNNNLAKLSIGQKRYYLEQQINFSGFDRPIPIQANNFKEVEANLDIQIRPIVSGNEQVTLDIIFEQSEFIGEFDVNIPPPQVSRKFESMIRVKNDEMIVLGGLEKETKIRNKRGLPWLSRIPVLGWLFGRQRREDGEDKLLIFIKPTVTYN